MLRSIPAIARTVLAACAVILLSAPSYGGEAFSERDERHRRFAPALGGDPDDRRLNDRLVAHELRLDI